VRWQKPGGRSLPREESLGIVKGKRKRGKNGQGGKRVQRHKKRKVKKNLEQHSRHQKPGTQVKKSRD